MFDDVSSMVGSVGGNLCGMQAEAAIVAPEEEEEPPSAGMTWPMMGNDNHHEDFPSSLWDYGDPFFFDF